MRGRGLSRRRGRVSQRVRPRTPPRAPARAGQHARAPRYAPPKMEWRRLTGHVTSPEKMHRGAIVPYWIITAWIGIPRSGTFPLPSHPQARAAPSAAGAPLTSAARHARAGRRRARSRSRTYALCGMPKPAPRVGAAPVRDPRAGEGRAPASQRARTLPQPGAPAWACRIARTSATPAP